MKHTISDNQLLGLVLAVTKKPQLTSRCPSKTMMRNFIHQRINKENERFMWEHINQCQACYDNWKDKKNSFDFGIMNFFQADDYSQTIWKLAACLVIGFLSVQMYQYYFTPDLESLIHKLYQNPVVQKQVSDTDLLDQLNLPSDAQLFGFNNIKQAKPLKYQWFIAGLTNETLPETTDNKTFQNFFLLGQWCLALESTYEEENISLQNIHEDIMKHLTQKSSEYFPKNDSIIINQIIEKIQSIIANNEYRPSSKRKKIRIAITTLIHHLLVSEVIG